MKTILPLLTCMLCCSLAMGQNPFEKFGYEPKIGTLSKGKYVEHFDTDSIVRIGSVLFNPFTKKITGFVKDEVVYSEATLQPEIVSRWLSPDPLSEEFPGTSPYVFTNNNPIFFTDPTGLAPQGLLDDYGIDENGNITLLNKTDDNFDRLYAVDSDGNKVDTNSDGNVGTDDSVVINDQTILPELSEVKETTQDSYHGEKNLRDATRDEGGQNDLFKIFQFASTNSNVEWSLYRFDKGGNELFRLGSYGNETLSPGASGLGDVSIISGVHSHPGIKPTLSSEFDSMGGDTMNKIRQLNSGKNYPSYTFFPNSQRLFNISHTGKHKFIRNIKGNYKRFFFGTLNSK